MWLFLKDQLFTALLDTIIRSCNAIVLSQRRSVSSPRIHPLSVDPQLSLVDSAIGHHRGQDMVTQSPLLFPPPSQVLPILLPQTLPLLRALGITTASSFMEAMLEHVRQGKASIIEAPAVRQVQPNCSGQTLFPQTHKPALGLLLIPPPHRGRDQTQEL